jgi:hypothetical protein
MTRNQRGKGLIVFLEKFRVCGLGGLGEVMHGGMVVVEVSYHVDKWREC